MHRFALIGLCFAILLTATVARADIFSSTGPNGETLGLQLNSIVNNGDGTSTYVLTLTVNSTGVATLAGEYIGSVALKIAAPSILGGTIVGQPGNSNFVEVFNNTLNANGCQLNGNLDTGGWLCGDAPTITAIPTGGIATFVFTITAPTGNFFADLNSNSVKVLYTDASGQKQDAIVSQGVPVTQVPEPSSLLLLGTGLVGLGGVVRRKMRR